MNMMRWTSSARFYKSTDGCSMQYFNKRSKQFADFKMQVKMISRTAKTAYNLKRIEDCSGDTKRLFRVAGDLLNRKQPSPLPTHVSAEDLATHFQQLFHR